MYTGRHYPLKEVSIWTRNETAIFFIIAVIPPVLHSVFKWTWITVPWLPIAMVGTAVAFITGFENNASYSRLWEARQIWGAIVNSSRTWGIMVVDFISSTDSAVSDEELRSVRARLIHRHVAWLTALRFQLREPRSWENMDQRENMEYRKKYHVPEWEGNLEEELSGLVEASDVKTVMGKKNRATHLIALQSKELRALLDRGVLTDYQYVEMVRGLSAFYDAQGKAERIKNFPYPRQYATLNLFFTWLFILLVPFGLLQEFENIHIPAAIWLTVPASVIVCWVFHTMNKIGEISENPFEGSPNDVPITTMSRTIEIDLREMLGEENIPAALPPVHNIQM